MKVKIIKCSKEDAWYKNQIGNILEVGEYNRYNYEIYLVPESNVVLYINKDDCELVREVYHGIEEFNKLSELFKNMTPEEYKKLYDESHNKSKVRIPDENTPVDTLVRVWDDKRDDGKIGYFYTKWKHDFILIPGGCTSITNTFPLKPQSIKSWKNAEIVEETIEEKRKRIFHKFVPGVYKWYAVDKDGASHYFYKKPSFDTQCGRIDFWSHDTCGHNSFDAGFADPYDWENSLIGREE